MSLVTGDKAVAPVVYWCSACNKYFAMTTDGPCTRTDKHTLVPIYVEDDTKLDDVLSPNDFGEGD